MDYENNQFLLGFSLIFSFCPVIFSHFPPFLFPVPRFCYHPSHLHPFHFPNKSNEKLVSTAAGCVWLCCPLMVLWITGWAYTQVCTLHICFSICLRVFFVTMRVKGSAGFVGSSWDKAGYSSTYSTPVLIMPANHKHPLSKHQAAAVEAFPPLQSPVKVPTVYFICILRWFKHRTGGTVLCTRCGGVLQQYKALAFVKHIARVAGNEADQSSPGTRTLKIWQRKGNSQENSSPTLLIYILCI